ncbi:hypothetical protein N7519_002494 [Penicillium mononematosum]|uniref:uncharacterized protein n=1 Tax=Penicillium mononematosum TaxID=268346 RepID=UPI002546890D|nr:uncharacterized protein N7519_002494 [Penicillium mononematosum]KAJ6187586.1 hypothetical protein N7519_002494 [Penicillium mononematosum]
MPLVILGGNATDKTTVVDNASSCARTPILDRGFSPAKRVLKRGQYRSGVRERYGMVEELRILDLLV